MFGKQSVYAAGKDNVKKTLEVFARKERNIKIKLFNKNKNESNKYSQYCNSIIFNKKCTALTFLSSFVLIEMRLCLMKHDWINLQKLFSLLLELSHNKETLIWKYALAILLHSPMSSRDHLEEFINLCIGCQNDNSNCILNQFIILKNEVME